MDTLAYKLTKYIDLSARLHRNHTRKDKDLTPYIAHPFQAMLIALPHTNDINTLASILLHDSIEDVDGYTFDDLVSDTNNDIANIVLHASHTGATGGWLAQKELYLDRLKNGPKESCIVSMCDKIHNMRSFKTGVLEDAENFMKKFNGSIENQLMFYDKVREVLGDRVDNENQLFALYKDTLEDLKRSVNLIHAKQY